MPVDRTRRFTLPNIQELSKDQDAALALPREGQHLIVGGPGTGKSVVALLRVQRLATENADYRFLAYNKLLDQSSRHLFGNGLKAFTLETWFRRLWQHLFKKSVPLQSPERPGGYQAIDWAVVTDWLQTNAVPQLPQALPLLVIDEGQDMPPAFYSALANIGFENFYVVADQNQQIHPDRCSARQDIENALAIAPADTLELQSNYRNTRPIAQLAQHFYPADPAVPRPELPDPKQDASTPELWCYGNGQGRTLEEIATRILQAADRNPRKVIGIISPNNNVRAKFVKVLNETNPALDHDKPQIRTFVSGQQEDLDFGRGGIMVINAQACKGLEFDTAILADIDEHQPRNNQDALKKRFYVMVARAREQIIFLRTGNPVPAIDDLLPHDQALLARK
jgi:superfamily I DNA/RNA helicase